MQCTPTRPRRSASGADVGERGGPSRSARADIALRTESIIAGLNIADGGVSIPPAARPILVQPAADSLRQGVDIADPRRYNSVWR